MMGSSEIDRNQRYLSQMTCNKLGSRFSGTKSRTALVSFPCIERPSPEGAGASGDSHGAALRASDFSSSGCLVGPSGRTLSGFKLSLESITGCSGYSSIKSSGAKGETPPIPDTGLLCEECVARVDVYREKARRLLTEGRFSTSDPKLSVLLCDSVWVPADRCDVCSTHLSQLKQEAVRTLLTRDRTIWPGRVRANAVAGSPASGAHTLPRACSARFPSSGSRQRSRSPEKHRWVSQPRHLHTLWPLSGNNGVSSFSHTTSHDALNKTKEDDAATSPAAVLCQIRGPLQFNASKVSTMLPAGTSAAVSFIVRAVQKLNLTPRRRKQRSDNDRHPTNFSGLLQKTPPPVPSSLLHGAGKSWDIPDTGKVKVMLRVSPLSRPDTSSRSQVLKLDLRRRQVVVAEPSTHSRPARLAGAASFTPKAFTFDAAFGPESSQAEVCERSLFEVLQSVVAGFDGCILSFGQSKEGTSYTMIGRDECASSIGVIPCAISWLFKLLNKKKDRTWANISVCVSAVEVCGETEVIRDLLSDIESGDRKDTHKSNVCLLEDPICGIKVCNNSVLSAPTAERAAFLLDAALASRRAGMTGRGGTAPHNCHMFFTLHVCQRHIECSTKSGMYVDQSKLSLIDLGTCTSESNKNNTAVCLVDLGNVIMAKLSGHKHLPNKGSKLAMLMQECLGNVNCCSTIIAHISTACEDTAETLCTIQIVSQIRRLQKKTRKSASSSPGGRSLSKERKVNTTPRLRAFRSAGTLNHDFSLPSLFDDLEERSGSDKSSDAVICMDPNGHVDLDQEVRGGQEFVPIIPSLESGKAGLKESSSAKHCDLLWSASQNPRMPKMETKTQTTQQKSLGCGIPDLECLKCNTFAELQNRLVCIDENDVASCKEQTANTVIISEPLSAKATKIHTEQPEVRGFPRKKDINDNGHRYSTQRDVPMKNPGEKPYRYISQTKTVPKIFHCSPRLEIVSSSTECELSAGSQSESETMPMIPSLNSAIEGLSSEDSTLPPKVRISPVGKSSSSLTAGLGSPASFPMFTEIPMENQKEMKATITVTVQQPLDLNGHDEVVYSVVEEVTISGAVNKGKHAKIASITDPNSSGSLPSESQPVMIISSVGGEQDAGDSVSQLQSSEKTDNSAVTPGNAIPFAANFIVSSQSDNDTSQLDNSSEESLNKTENIMNDAPKVAPIQCEVLHFREQLCEIRVEQNATRRKCSHGNGQNSKEINGSVTPGNQKMLSDDYRMEPEKDPISTYFGNGTSWLSPEKQNNYKDFSHPSVKQDMEPKRASPRTTLERKFCPVTHGFLQWAGESESTSSVEKPDKSSPNKRNRKPFMTPCLELDQPNPDNKLNKNTPKSPVEDSGKLFSAKLEQLANRSRSQGRSCLEGFEFRFVERSANVCSQDCSGRLVGGCTLPRVTKKQLEQENCIALGSKGHLEGSCASVQTKGMTWLASKTSFEDNLPQASCSLKRVPRFYPMHDIDHSDTTQSSKPSQSKMTTNEKVLSSPKMSGTIPKKSSAFPKSTRHSINRSSSLSPDGFSVKQISWSSQSLSRKQGKVSLSSKHPGKALNGRVELLRAGGDSLCSSSQSSLDSDDPEESNGAMKLLPQPLPSPYSRITPPRKPSHCSGNASDNTSVLSGELPPAMCKTALLYHRNSTVSSGYESMMRDSEAMCSSTSTHDSISDQSFFFSSPRSSKKRINAGSRQRHSSQDTHLSEKRTASSSKSRPRVDRGTSESYEIKVYEIDSVSRFKKRGEAGNKSVVCFSAKLKFLEHRQQRIAEVSAKYNNLKRELEQAKQHLMIDPRKWTREFDLWQTFEVDSLEHLEALELVTRRLESQVGNCKASVMMATCFDATPKRRKKTRLQPQQERPRRTQQFNQRPVPYNNMQI